MKVALVHDFLNQWGGAERVLDALHELYPEAPVFTLMYDPARTHGHFKGWNIKTSFLQSPWIAPLRKYVVTLYPAAIEQFDFKDFDLVISSANSFAKGVLTRPETLHITYCHTPTAYLWVRPEQYLAEQRLNVLTSWLARRTMHRLRQWDRVAAERVDIWVANSKNVQERIAKFYRKKSTVIYPPVETQRFKIAAPQDYFLFVGRLSAYKKADVVVEAFNRLGWPLTIIGDGDERAKLESRARPNVRFTGWLPDTDVARYLSGCRALVFAVEEDFGLVPVEAMAAGRPVIALNKGGATETVIEGKTGFFFGEQTVDSLISALDRFSKSAQSFHPKAIRAHAQQFDRSVFLRRMKDFVDKAYTDHQNR